MTHSSRSRLVRQRRRSQPQEVAGLLDAALQQFDRKGRLQPYRIWGFWAEEVGEAVARRAAPARFAHGVLTVRVASAAWMQELRYMKEDLRQRLNARLGAELVEDIAFEAGSAAPAAKPAPRRAAPTAEEAPAAPVEIPPLADPRLQEVFARLARAHAARRRRG